jgi:RNA recognition motif-containing protein
VKEDDLMSDKMETTNHFVGPPENGNIGPGEPESPRLFIGQVPKSMEADDLRKVFEGFGKILDISILKDKATGVHKGKFPSIPNVTYCFRMRIFDVFAEGIC